MSRALACLVTGAALLIAAAAGRRSTDRASAVPRVARRLGEHGSLEEWKAGNRRAGTAMTWAGAALLLIGAVVLVVEAFN